MVVSLVPEEVAPVLVAPLDAVPEAGVEEPVAAVEPPWAPPPTDPPAAICCCTTWASSCGAVLAVQVAWPPVETDSTFTETWASYDGPRGCIAGRWTRLAGDTIAWAGGGSYRARLGAEAQELIFYAVPPGAAETAPGSETSTAAASPLAFPVEAYQRVDSTDTADLQLAASCRAR